MSAHGRTPSKADDVHDDFLRSMDSMVTEWSCIGLLSTAEHAWLHDFDSQRRSNGPRSTSTVHRRPSIGRLGGVRPSHRQHLWRARSKSAVVAARCRSFSPSAGRPRVVGAPISAMITTLAFVMGGACCARTAKLPKCDEIFFFFISLLVLLTLLSPPLTRLFFFSSPPPLAFFFLLFIHETLLIFCGYCNGFAEHATSTALHRPFGCIAFRARCSG